MKIACLGWGSLVWNPGSLLIRREWFLDGPILPIEFARCSNDGRLTLVITENAKHVRALWSLMATDELKLAKKSLLVREGIPEKKSDEFIGCLVVNEEQSDQLKIIIKEWAITLNLDAVVWTNLPPKYNNVAQVPTMEQAVNYLRDLDINARTLAEEYIRKTPKQIDTDYRRQFEIEFGWNFLESR